MQVKVYEWKHNSKSMVLAAAEDRDHPLVADFDGTSKAAEWLSTELKTLNKKTIK